MILRPEVYERAENRISIFRASGESVILCTELPVSESAGENKTERLSDFTSVISTCPVRLLFVFCLSGNILMKPLCPPAYRQPSSSTKAALCRKEETKILGSSTK